MQDHAASRLGCVDVAAHEHEIILLQEVEALDRVPIDCKDNRAEDTKARARVRLEV